eukprot:scaffold12324_cov144-Cylindrotheca_fusiformis.AAC.2
MKHHILNTIPLRFDADEGPARKRQRFTKAEQKPPQLSLESLILAGRALSSYEDKHENETARVTPVKELQDEEKELSDAVSMALAAVPTIHAPTPIRPATKKQEKPSQDWKKFCRPLAAPPRLPNVPFGSLCCRGK